MPARYVFTVRFHLHPNQEVSLDPAVFETTMYRDADHPADGDGWLFFRDHLWRGDLADPDHFVQMTADALDVPVKSVDYRRFEVDEDHYDALKEAIEANLPLFRAERVTEVLNKYFGSSIEVTRA